MKGVIRDRDEAVALARNQRNRDVEEMNRAMERANLGGKTWAEEEREKRWQDILEGNAGLSPEALFAMGMSGSGMDKMMGDGAKKGRFGHLREVGMRGYVSAVEDEDRDVWVVVHIYDPVSLRLRCCLRIWTATVEAFVAHFSILGPMRWWEPGHVTRSYAPFLSVQLPHLLVFLCLCTAGLNFHRCDL